MKIRMFKTLFKIYVIVIGFAMSAHAENIPDFNSIIEQTSLESSDEVSGRSPSHHQFFDVQREQFSVVSNVDIEPLPLEEIAFNNAALTFRSQHLLVVQCAQYERAMRKEILHTHLKVILFPFHAFW
ncbi:hypothetical protein [Winogradskyella sediminis]|nr:hypothetical protein [Winogradskyella sediminis]